MRFNDWISHHARVSPQKPALVLLDEELSLTYAELDRRVCRATRWLASEGVGAGDRVAVFAPNHSAHFELYFATARLTALFIPLNNRLAAAELETVLGLAQPKILVAAVDLLDTASRACPPSTRLFSLDGRSSGTARYAARLLEVSDSPFEAAPATLETVHQVLYTSGTTGKPKGAMITLGQVHWNSVNTGIATDLTSADSTVTYTPLFHTGGLHVLSTPLFHRGGTVYLSSGFDPEKILAAYERYGITTLFGVPTTFQMLAAAPSFASRDLAKVRFCLCGGAPCPIPLIELYATRGLVFRQGFGMTEVGPNCFSLPPEDAVRKAGTVGRPMLHVDARVVDGDGNPVPTDGIGELELAGPVVSAGYLDDAPATAASRRDAWLRTGDLASIDSEGYFRIVGRRKEMWISGGENVYPAELENALARHPAIAEAACFGVPDPKWGEVGWAAVVPRAGTAITGEALIEYLREILARYKVPRRIELFPDLPKNASGKVLKQELRERMVASAGRPEGQG